MFESGIGRRHEGIGQGKEGAHGAPPLGYRAEEGELVTDSAEQETLTRIHQLHEEGKSFRRIAEALTREGYKPKRGDTWHPETLRRIVSRLAEN